MLWSSPKGSTVFDLAKIKTFCLSSTSIVIREKYYQRK